MSEKFFQVCNVCLVEVPRKSRNVRPVHSRRPLGGMVYTSHSLHSDQPYKNFICKNTFVFMSNKLYVSYGMLTILYTVDQKYRAACILSLFACLLSYSKSWLPPPPLLIMYTLRSNKYALFSLCFLLINQQK